jgi:Protein of unknown function (DUF3761)
MFRGLPVAAAFAAAAIGAASTVEGSGSATSSVIFTGRCPPGEFVTDVTCVPGTNPTPPPGSTYQCKDGCFSDSKHSGGACSHHGGIAGTVSTGP